MPSARSHRALLVASLVLVCAFVLTAAPDDAHADLYTYQLPDGSTLITSERRSGLKLLEHIGSGGGSSSSSKGGGSGGRTINKKHQLV